MPEQNGSNRLPSNAMPRQGFSPALLAGTAYLAIVFAAGFALGTLRTLFLEDDVGWLPGNAIELPFMLTVSWLVCG